jgi:hypothetical protein
MTFTCSECHDESLHRPGYGKEPIGRDNRIHARQRIDSPTYGLALSRHVQKTDPEMAGSIQDLRRSPLHLT